MSQTGQKCPSGKRPQQDKGGEKIEKEKANDSNSNHSYFIDVCFFI